MVQAELVNGRFAMLGLAGILIPSLLTKIGAGNFPIWYEAGEVSAKSGNIPTGSLIAVEAVLVGFAEIKRWQEWRKPGSQSEPGAFLGLEGFFKGTGDPSYPGGVFDPMGMSKGSDAQFAELKLKEVKNGRLAMLAFLGCWCQYVATKKSPMDNLFDHLANPTYNNFATNGISTPDWTKSLLPAYVHAH